MKVKKAVSGGGPCMTRLHALLRVVRVFLDDVARELQAVFQVMLRDRVCEARDVDGGGSVEVPGGSRTPCDRVHDP